MPSDNRTGFWRGLTATLGLAATAAIPGQAQAQVSNASAVPDLEEIVVTARRREESLVDVPVSVTVMNSDFIEQNNIFNTQALFAEDAGRRLRSDWRPDERHHDDSWGHPPVRRPPSGRK